MSENSHEEVVWLDVPVDEVLGVDVFDPGDQLIGKQEDSLEAESPAKCTVNNK